MTPVCLKFFRKGINSFNVMGVTFASGQQFEIIICFFYLKGNLRSKKGFAQMKEREKCKKKEPSLTLMCQMVLEISHFKVRNLSKIDVDIL